MKLKSFAAVALILIPGLAFAANGGGTGISNAGNGGPSGANSDASNANTPVGSTGANGGNSASDRAGMSGHPSTALPAIMGTPKEMTHQIGEPQKNP